MIQHIERHAPSGHLKYKIFTLDNYSAHLHPRIEKSLYQKSYILVLIDGGTMGDVQGIDTALHRKAKTEYREAKLNKDPEKIPFMSRDNNTQCLTDSYKSLDIDHELVFKDIWLTNAIDGSKDIHVSSRLQALIGDKFKAFRKDLLEKETPATLKYLPMSITRPEGE